MSNRWLLSLCCLIALCWAVTADNDVCCRFKGVGPRSWSIFAFPKKCSRASHRSSRAAADGPYYQDLIAMNRCFGGTGADCDGVPIEQILSALYGKVGKFERETTSPTSWRPLVKQLGGGRVDMVVTVGSIRHDICCLKNPHGLFCNKYNYPWSFNKVASRCACADEWRKAFWNLVRGFYWRTEANGGAEKAEDLQLGALSDARVPWLPMENGVYITGATALHGMGENVVTKRLYAPEGTLLECPLQDPKCEFDCSSSARNSGACKKGKYSWSVTLDTPKAAGDSVFCASGKFKALHVSNDWKVTFGVCAGGASSSSSTGARSGPAEYKGDFGSDCVEEKDVSVATGDAADAQPVGDSSSATGALSHILDLVANRAKVKPPCAPRSPAVETFATRYGLSR